jgi:hypothetical protein
MVDIGAFTLPISSLQLNTTYHYRAQLEYISGVTPHVINGSDIAFTTLRTPAGSTVIQVLGCSVFRSYVEDNDLLFTILAVNTYPPYYGIEDPRDYFVIQLLNPAGTTVIAATPLKNWGETPQSIYLSPNSALSITIGAAYKIRMIGLFPTPPSDTYTLTPADWKGTDLVQLDKWIIRSAKEMNIYDNNVASRPYVTKNSVGGEILTTYGGADFVEGIPAIMLVRPDIFQTSMRNPNYDYDSETSAFDSATTWQNEVGTQIASDATAFGAVIGVTARSFLSMGIWVFYVLSMIFVFASSKGQGAETVFVGLLNVPILFIGLQFRLIDFQVVAIMAVISVLIFLLKAWFNK